MMRLKIAEIGKGLHPSETVVSVNTVTGTERLVVSKRSIEAGYISVGYPLGTKDSTTLVELPRETQTGAWRVWVSDDQLSSTKEERLRA